MAAVGEGGLRAVRDLLLVCYAEGIIGDEEYLILLEMNHSREIFPYWTFKRFDFDDWDGTRCRTDL